MSISITDRTIDLELIRKIKEISGQNVYKCMQCGTCAGACPMRELMDYGPTRIIHMLHFGQGDKLVDSRTVWLCASCHECQARCPRGIEIPKVMEAVRLLTLRQNRNYIEPFEIEEIRELPQIAAVSSFRKLTA